MISTTTNVAQNNSDNPLALGARYANATAMITLIQKYCR